MRGMEYSLSKLSLTTQYFIILIQLPAWLQTYLRYDEESKKFDGPKRHLDILEDLDRNE